MLLKWQPQRVQSVFREQVCRIETRAKAGDYRFARRLIRSCQTLGEKVGIGVLLLVGSLVGAQSLQPTIRVDGTTLVTSRPVTPVGDEWFVPLMPIALAVGAKLDIIPSSQSIHVLRRDGTVVDYESRTGQIRQGFTLIGEIKNFRQVQFDAGIDNLLFPLGGVVALLGVNARENVDRNVLEINSSPESGSGRLPQGPAFEIAELDYDYNLTTTGQAWEQAAQLQGKAVLGSRRMTGSALLNQVPGSPVLHFREGVIRLDLLGRRAITVGDQATYSGVDALGAGVRGAGFEMPWGGFLVNLYAGRAAGSITSVLGSSQALFDTTSGGFQLRRNSKKSDFSLAGNVFRGATRRGEAFGAAYAGARAANHFKIQGVLGSFSGLSPSRVLLPASSATAAGEQTAQLPVHGGAYGFNVSDSFTPFRNKLAVTGVWEKYSRNFLTVRDESRFSAISRKALSAVVQPSRYISLSAGASDSVFLVGNPERLRGYSYGISTSAPGRVPIQFGYFRSVQASPSIRLDLVQYSLQLPHLGRYAAGVTYSEIRSNGQVQHVVGETFSADSSSFGLLGLHDQLQLNNTNTYGIDWSRQFGDKGAYFRVGLERQTSLLQASRLAPVAAIRLPLRGGQRLTFSYLRSGGTSMLQFQIGGPVVRRRELIEANGGPITMVVLTSLSGQVYHDVHLDGKYDSRVDRPIAQLQVWLNNEKSTVTDASGYFRFDGISPGTYRLRAELTTLPANLIFAESDERIVAAMPYRTNREDFRAITTGQIQGRVTIARDVGPQAPEQPFPDARIVATGDRETFSEANGVFILSDLPPGMYDLRLDPTTVPAGFVSEPAVRTAELKPGQNLREVDFHLARPVIEIPVPPQPSPPPGR
jgi:hypothetical protein